MASVGISSPGGQVGGAAGQVYYCFDCDCNMTMVASQDSVHLCPTCGHVVLEEFDTHFSPPPPPPPPPASVRSTAFDLLSFFPTSSDADSDDELSEPLPPPPPPFPFFITSPNATAADVVVPDTVDYLSHLQMHPSPPTPQPRSTEDFYCLLDREVRHVQPPSFPPRRAQFPIPPPDFEAELDPLPPSPPLPPTPPPAISPLFSTSNDVEEVFYSPSTELEEDLPELPPPPPPLSPPPPPPISRAFESWDFFFSDSGLNSPHDDIPSGLQPPPPPPWPTPQPMEDLPDTKMTKSLLSEWESHQCSICIDNFELNQKVKLTPCNHLYHSDCLLRWLALHKSCPVCRCKIPSLMFRISEPSI